MRLFFPHWTGDHIATDLFRPAIEDIPVFDPAGCLKPGGLLIGSVETLKEGGSKGSSVFLSQCQAYPHTNDKSSSCLKKTVLFS